MAGFFTRLQGYVYNGDHYAAAPLPNGIFAEIGSAGVTPVAGAKDTKFRVQEKTSLFGMPALILDVVSVGADEVFFTENELPALNDVEWNEALYTLPSGKQVRMKRPLPGEQVIMTVDASLYDGVNIGDIVAPASGGAVAVQ